MGVCYTSATTSATAATKGCTNAASNLDTSGPLLIGLWDTTLSLFFSLFFGTWCATTYYDKGAVPGTAAGPGSYRRRASVDHPACIMLDVGITAQSVTPPKSNSHRNPQSLARGARSTSRGTVLPNQAIGVYGKTGLTDMASCC